MIFLLKERERMVVAGWRLMIDRERRPPVRPRGCIYYVGCCVLFLFSTWESTRMIPKAGKQLVFP